MEKIVNIKDRLEEWRTVFSSEVTCFRLSVSNHGRMSVTTQHDKVILDLVETSNAVLSLQNGIDAICVGPLSD